MHAEPTDAAIPSRSSDIVDGGAVRVAGDQREVARQALLRVAGQLGAVDGEDRLLEPLAEAAERA